MHAQGGRWIAYIGLHGGSARKAPGGKQEANGTAILDVSDPRSPKWLAHIPGEPGAGAQMVRVCDGSELPRADQNSVYLLRTLGNSAHEIWNVADPARPVLVSSVARGLQGTHKNWWECDSGIAYLVSGVPGWRTSRMTQIFDLGDPAKPVFIRDFGLPGQQPGASGPVPTELHGPISTGPKGKRVYFAHGTSSYGVLQIVDRDKLLNGPKAPTPENLLYPQVGRLDLGPDAGAHTAFPVLGMKVSGAAGGHDWRARFCRRHQRIPGRGMPRAAAAGVDGGCERRSQAAGGGELDRRRGERQLLRPRRALRHAFVERKLHADLLQTHHVLRAFQRRRARGGHPRSGSSQGNRLLHTRGGRKGAAYTNNVEVDERGYIYIVDRAGAGLHILELSGPARAVAAVE